jgi:osmotically-inducible protein OsmY
MRPSHGQSRPAAKKAIIRSVILFVNRTQEQAMKISCKTRNWVIGACIVPLASGVGAFASPVEAQTTTSNTVSRSSTIAAPTSPDADSNETLARQVRAALRADRYLDDEHIDVSVENGVVTLRGLVFDDRDLRSAMRIARKAAGGRLVIDNLSIED